MEIGKFQWLKTTANIVPLEFVGIPANGFLVRMCKRVKVVMDSACGWMESFDHKLKFFGSGLRMINGSGCEILDLNSCQIVFTFRSSRATQLIMWMNIRLKVKKIRLSHFLMKKLLKFIIIFYILIFMENCKFKREKKNHGGSGGKVWDWEDWEWEPSGLCSFHRSPCSAAHQGWLVSWSPQISIAGIIFICRTANRI